MKVLAKVWGAAIFRYRCFRNGTEGQCHNCVRSGRTPEGAALLGQLLRGGRLVCVYIYIYIYIYVSLSLSLSLSLHIYIYIYIYICTHLYRPISNRSYSFTRLLPHPFVWSGAWLPPWPAPAGRPARNVRIEFLNNPKKASHTIIKKSRKSFLNMYRSYTCSVFLHR